MGYLKAYRMFVENVEGQTLVCDLIDKTTQVPEEVSTEYTVIEGAEAPLVLSVIDNDEDRFTTIRAHQLEIAFLSTPEVDLNAFTEGPDNRWFVELSFSQDGGNTLQRIFTGYLSMSDLQEDFLSDPNVVTLTASDMLGSLKDVPMVDLNGVNPKGKYSVIEYLTMALGGTGMTLSLNVCNSLWADNMNIVDGIDQGWYYTYLEAKTFEDEIGTCLDCYTVLERILGQNCFLTQYRGEWWVVRVEEMDGRGLKVHRFDINGGYVETIARQVYEREIFSEGEAYFSGEQTYVTTERPFKSVKETYGYQYPKEIVDNIDFARGGVNYVLVPPANHVFFHIEDWQVVRPFGQPATSSAYYARKYEDGYEKEGYAVVTPQSVYASPYDYLRSNPIELQYKDRAKISVDFRFDANLTGVGGMSQYIFFIYLYTGTTYYYLSQDTSGDFSNLYWYETSEENVRLIAQSWNSNNQDETDWQNISITAPPLPEDGQLFIGLMNGKTNVNFSGNMHYKSLQVDIEAYINGSYQKYEGHYYKVEQAGGYNAVKEEDVYLSDSPRKLFKGALWSKQVLELAGIQIVEYFLSTKWNDRSNLEAGWKPYGWWQAFSVWNQCRRTMRLFDASVQGCYGEDLFGFIHLFKLLDASPHTNNKQFMLLHYELDLYTCEWSGVLAEVIDTTKGKTYSEVDNQFSFKYLEDRS